MTIVIICINEFIIIYTLPVIFDSYFIQVIKNSDGQFNLEAAIKNIDTMSNELKKINGNSDFTMQLNTKTVWDILLRVCSCSGLVFCVRQLGFNVMKQ